MEYKKYQDNRKKQIGKKWVNTDRLFVNEVGEAIDPRKATYWFTYFQMHNGIKNKIRLHDLRHLHISLLILNGLDIETVAERAGHSSANTTLNIYTHILKEVDYRAVDIITSKIYKREA